MRHLSSMQCRTAQFTAIQHKSTMKFQIKKESSEFLVQRFNG